MPTVTAGPATPMPGPAAAVALPRSGRVIGYVSGGVADDVERQGFSGQRVLVIVMLVASVVAIANILVGGAGVVVNSIGPLLVVVALVAIYGFINGRWLGRALATAGTGAAKGASVIARKATSATARGAWAGISRGRSVHDVPVRRFQVRPLTGGLLPCVWFGDPNISDLRHADTVRVTGRRTRAGDFMVGQIEILDTPAGPIRRVIRSRRIGVVFAARWWSRSCYATAVLLAVWTAVVLVKLVT